MLSHPFFYLSSFSHKNTKFSNAQDHKINYLQERCPQLVLHKLRQRCSQVHGQDEVSDLSEGEVRTFLTDRFRLTYLLSLRYAFLNLRLYLAILRYVTLWVRKP